MSLALSYREATSVDLLTCGAPGFADRFFTAAPSCPQASPRCLRKCFCVPAVENCGKFGHNESREHGDAGRTARSDGDPAKRNGFCGLGVQGTQRKTARSRLSRNRCGDGLRSQAVEACEQQPPLAGRSPGAVQLTVPISTS